MIFLSDEEIWPNNGKDEDVSLQCLIRVFKISNACSGLFDEQYLAYVAEFKVAIKATTLRHNGPPTCGFYSCINNIKPGTEFVRGIKILVSGVDKDGKHFKISSSSERLPSVFTIEDTEKMWVCVQKLSSSSPLEKIEEFIVSPTTNRHWPVANKGSTSGTAGH